MYILPAQFAVILGYGAVCGLVAREVVLNRAHEDVGDEEREEEHNRKGVCDGKPGERGLELGFRVLGFGFRISGFGFRVSGLGFRV